eukprot:m.408638 g.408638  ORF g.408638 m.408638 type:complete len:69 (+) comp20149_c1_seq1:5870-6076(+)
MRTPWGSCGMQWLLLFAQRTQHASWLCGCGGVLLVVVVYVLLMYCVNSAIVLQWCRVVYGAAAVVRVF